MDLFTPKPRSIDATIDAGFGAGATEMLPLLSGGQLQRRSPARESGTPAHPYDENALIWTMAKIQFEENLVRCDIPRLGMRTAKWDELGETQERYIKAMAAAFEMVRPYLRKMQEVNQ